MPPRPLPDEPRTRRSRPIRPSVRRGPPVPQSNHENAQSASPDFTTSGMSPLPTPSPVQRPMAASESAVNASPVEMPSRHTASSITDNDCDHPQLNTVVNIQPADVGREDGGAPRNTQYQRPAAFLKLPFRRAPVSNSSTHVADGERNGPAQPSINPTPVRSDQQEPQFHLDVSQSLLFPVRATPWTAPVAQVPSTFATPDPQSTPASQTTGYPSANNTHFAGNHAGAPPYSENTISRTTRATDARISAPRETPGAIFGSGGHAEFDAHATDVWLETVRQQFEESSIDVPTIPSPLLFFAFKELTAREILVIPHVTIPPIITLKAILNLVMKSGTSVASTLRAYLTQSIPEHFTVGSSLVPWDPSMACHSHFSSGYINHGTISRLDDWESAQFSVPVRAATESMIRTQLLHGYALHEDTPVLVVYVSQQARRVHTVAGTAPASDPPTDIYQCIVSRLPILSPYIDGLRSNSYEAAYERYIRHHCQLWLNPKDVVSHWMGFFPSSGVQGELLEIIVPCLKNLQMTDEKLLQSLEIFSLMRTPQQFNYQKLSTLELSYTLTSLDKIVSERWPDNGKMF
ncbi:hypothetical protein BD410DRAFT_834982 [Rickenella mellea]|uniref:Uncharacterized protein n=1 Tax=Rickenella mellea TaxID=50990 RepID=A0A4Y7QNZ9_9AGAM|nr:hypothetical protein BD410DRAFT_834982 [Rickenella mellea]